MSHGRGDVTRGHPQTEAQQHRQPSNCRVKAVYGLAATAPPLQLHSSTLPTHAFAHSQALDATFTVIRTEVQGLV